MKTIDVPTGTTRMGGSATDLSLLRKHVGEPVDITVNYDDHVDFIHTTVHSVSRSDASDCVILNTDSAGSYCLTPSEVWLLLKLGECTYRDCVYAADYSDLHVAVTISFPA